MVGCGRGEDGGLTVNGTFGARARIALILREAFGRDLSLHRHTHSCSSRYPCLTMLAMTSSLLTFDVLLILSGSFATLVLSSFLGELSCVLSGNLLNPGCGLVL